MGIWFYFFLRFYLLICMFVYFWLCSAFVAVLRLSLVAGQRLLHCSLQASHCGGFSCRRAHRKHVGCSMWDLPRPGVEPVSPALAGGFLNHYTTREVPNAQLLTGS